MEAAGSRFDLPTSSVAGRGSYRRNDRREESKEEEEIPISEKDTSSTSSPDSTSTVDCSFDYRRRS
jgi:hypothetical protein